MLLMRYEWYRDLVKAKKGDPRRSATKPAVSMAARS